MYLLIIMIVIMSYLIRRLINWVERNRLFQPDKCPLDFKNYSKATELHIKHINTSSALFGSSSMIEKSKVSTKPTSLLNLTRCHSSIHSFL